MTSLAYAALWIFIFSLPWEIILALPGVAVVSKATGALAASLALLTVLISGRLRRWHGLHVAAGLFVGWAAIGLLVLHSRGERLPHKFWTYVQLLIVLWMIWEIARSRRASVGLLLAYVSGAYVAAFQTIMAFRRDPGLSRRFAVGGDSNDLAMTLVLALPMAWYLGTIYRHPVLRWGCRAYLPVGLVALGLTGSRGGMVAGVVALLIVPLSMTRLTAGRLATAIAMLGISGALAVTYVPDKIVERLATTGNEVQDLNLGGRFKLWDAGIRVLPEHPLMGFGTSNYKSAITPVLGPASQVAHNSYVSVLVEQGLVGFALYALMFFAVLRAVLTLPTPERRFALVLLATLGTTMLPLTWEDRKPVWVVLACLLALAQSHGAGTGGAVPQAGRRWVAPFSRRPMAPRPREPITVRGRQAGPDALA